MMRYWDFNFLLYKGDPIWYNIITTHMQTFLPYSDLKQSAKVLDNKRLGKQRVEAYQILKALTLDDYGWRNHPAVKMWKGHRLFLILNYLNDITREWTARGYNDTTYAKAMAFCLEEHKIGLDELRAPSWFGDERFHSSHRSNLLRKDPVYYGQFGWTEPADLEYYWPVTK